MIYRSCIMFWCMFGPVKQQWKDTVLSMTFWFHTGLQGRAERRHVSLPVVWCQQTASAVTLSSLKRLFTWISSITLMPQRQPEQHEPTASSSYQAKNNSDSNWYKYISFWSRPPPKALHPPRLSFVCLFSFRDSRRHCAKVAFVCDDPTEQLSWVWSAEIQEVGPLFNPRFVINGDT